jgi:hypothetical protein
MFMKTIHTAKDLSLKDGTIIPKGTVLDWKGPGKMETVGLFDYRGRELKMRYRSVIQTPSMDELEEWSNDGICESVFGERVEPDGHDEDGAPSWLLAMGMI